MRPVTLSSSPGKVPIADGVRLLQRSAAASREGAGPVLGAGRAMCDLQYLTALPGTSASITVNWG